MTARLRYTRTWAHDEELGWRVVAAHIAVVAPPNLTGPEAPPSATADVHSVDARACSWFDRCGPASQSCSRRASTGSSPRRSASM